MQGDGVTAAAAAAVTCDCQMGKNLGLVALARIDSSWPSVVAAVVSELLAENPIRRRIMLGAAMWAMQVREYVVQCHKVTAAAAAADRYSSSSRQVPSTTRIINHRRTWPSVMAALVRTSMMLHLPLLH